MSTYKAALIFLIALSGCAHTRSPAPQMSSTSWLDSYDSSGSLCIDSFVVNSASAGCSTWNVRDFEGAAELRCLEHAGEDNFWVSSTFVYYMPNIVESIAGLEPICGDLNGILGVLRNQ